MSQTLPKASPSFSPHSLKKNPIWGGDRPSYGSYLAFGRGLFCVLLWKSCLIYQYGLMPLMSCLQIGIAIARPLRTIEYNSFMRTHHTYSLNTILNTQQLKPQLYQQILHELKSPLEQVSIDLTHDNSVDQVTPKRPNIPPPPPKSPLNQLQQCNFSRTHESMSLPVGQSRRKEYFHDQVMESVLSPLDQQISFKEQPNGAALFCGALLESVLGSEGSFQIQLPPRTRVSKRRPIFEGKKSSRSSKSAEEVISILLNMGELQMAAFLQLLRDLQCELQRVAVEREEAKKSLSAILGKMSSNIQFVGQQNEDQLATYRLLRRLRTKNTYELVTKLLREQSPVHDNQAQNRLQRLLQSLSRLETIISKFMGKNQSIQILEAVYQIMEQAHSQQPTLLCQLQRLCYSFGWKADLSDFQFVWRQGGRRKLSKQQFVEGVSMNDCVIRVPRSFEQELQSKGFTRNH